MKHVLALFLFFTASVALAQDEDRPPTQTEAPETAENPVPAEGEGAPDAVVEAEKAAPPKAEPTKAAVEEKATQNPADDGSGEAVYRSRIFELQGRVNHLKEKIFQTKTRIAILKENVLSKTIAGAEGRLMHQNEMGASYALEKMVYSLDGTPIFSRVDLEGGLSDQDEIELFNGPIVPGTHTLSVMMVYRGRGFGVFSYLKGYVYTLRSSHTFHAEEGKRLTLKTIAFEKGAITTDHRDRPAIRFESTISEPGRGAAGNQGG